MASQPLGAWCRPAGMCVERGHISFLEEEGGYTPSGGSEAPAIIHSDSPSEYQLVTHQTRANSQHTDTEMNTSRGR